MFLRVKMISKSGFLTCLMLTPSHSTKHSGYSFIYLIENIFPFFLSAVLMKTAEADSWFIICEANYWLKKIQASSLQMHFPFPPVLSCQVLFCFFLFMNYSKTSLSHFSHFQLLTSLRRQQNKLKESGFPFPPLFINVVAEVHSSLFPDQRFQDKGSRSFFWSPSICISPREHARNRVTGEWLFICTIRLVRRDNFFKMS